MAFNQGPQPDIVFNENGVRYIDPNPTNQTVNHEDLITYVKLVARSKGRSILTTENNERTIAENQFQNVKGETNFTYETGKSFLDSSWTNVGGGNLELGENLGTLGITNIDIQFKSSFMPQIVIDFVDIRGSALFEQGTCSPYSLFFHLPYPVFELTVKGYYGKPVTYTLALIKFNTKFNAETGNFESKAEFVGYTYAFLADLPIGYIMASTYMKEGRGVLVDKWKKVVDRPEFRDEFYGLDPSKPITIYDLIRKSKKLETEVPKFKNSKQIKDLSKYNNAKQALNELNREINNFKRELINADCKIKTNSNNQKTIFYFESQNNNINTSLDGTTKRVNEVIEKYLGDDDENVFKTKILGTKLEETNTYLKQIDLPDVVIDINKIKENCVGLFGGETPIANSNGLYERSIDLYYGLIENVNKSTNDLDGKYKKEKDETQRLLNERVRGILDFWPSVRNIFVVLTTNTEVFLELLARTSKNAEQYHIENPINGGTNNLSLDLKNTSTENNTIYPWPTYYESTDVGDGDGGSRDSGEKETYPGKNIKYIGWPEVRFVEDFIKALTELKDELKTLEASNLNNEPGFDNFAPITAFETHAFGEDKAPNRWLNIQNGIKGVNGDLLDSIYCVMGENAFLLGDYSMINSLSVWKSQLGFDYDWNGTTGPKTLADAFNSNDIDKSKPNLGRWNDKGFEFKDPHYGMFKGKISPTTTTRMKQWGKVDALNMMSTLGSDGQTSLLTTIKANLTTDKKSDIKEKIKKALKQKYPSKFKSQTFDEWKVYATQTIGGTTDLIDKQNIWDNTFSGVTKNGNPVLTLTGPIELSHSDIVESRISANPYNNPFGGVRLVRNSELEDRSINFSDDNLLKQLQGLYKEYFGDYNSKTENLGTTSVDTTGENKKKEKKEITDPNSISVLTLKNRPRPKDKTKYFTPYGETDNDTLNKKLKINDNLNMLTYNFDDFRTMFYYTQEDSKLSYLDEDEGIDTYLYDLGSFRKIVSNNGVLETSNFISSTYTDGIERDTLLVQLPLWTLNYPPYKNPWYGLENYILHDEVVSFNLESKTIDFDDPSEFLKNDATNITRNFATWWGMNQYYRDDEDINSNKYLLPLAYLTVMSFGFYTPDPKDTEEIKVDEKSLSKWTGHFPPFDGNNPTSVSSFSNFTHSHVVAETPKSWLLLLGSILWRAKEGGVLNNSYDNLQPTHTEGWNEEDLSKGVNNDGDPVWFFHTPLSKPWWLGGSVFAIESPSSSTDNKGVTLEYQRVYLGEESDGTDRWTSSLGSEFFTGNRGPDKPVVIGPWEADKLSTMTNPSLGSREITWENKDSDAKIYFKNGIRAYQLTKTTQYEVPFLKPDSKLKQYESRPKTLTLKFDGIGEYINITKQMKELMFLPTSFKKELIKYFENWGSNEVEAFSEKKGWLTTLDPLNWETGKGLTYYKPNVNPLDYKDVGQLGYQGYLSESHTTGMLTGSIYGENKKNTNNKGGGEFTEDNFGYNKWANSYLLKED